MWLSVFSSFYTLTLYILEHFHHMHKSRENRAARKMVTNMTTGYLVINDCPIIVSRQQSQAYKSIYGFQKKKTNASNFSVCLFTVAFSFRFSHLQLLVFLDFHRNGVCIWTDPFFESILIKCWCRHNITILECKEAAPKWIFQTNLLELAHKIITKHMKVEREKRERKQKGRGT